MRGVITNPVFYGSVILAILSRFLEEMGVYLPFVHSYLDDLLCFPIVLSLGLIGYRIVTPSYILTKWHMWLVVAIYSVYFELYLPTTSVINTADFVDVIMYGLGAFVFDRTVNKLPKGGDCEDLTQAKTQAG